MIQRGCMVNVRDKHGMLPLYYAIKNVDQRMISILLEAKANVNSTVPFHKSSGKLCERSLISIAVSSVHMNDQIIQLLIEANADVTSTKEDLVTEAYQADYSNLEIVKLLIKHKAHIPFPNDVLYHAMENERMNLVSLIIKSGYYIPWNLLVHDPISVW